MSQQMDTNMASNPIHNNCNEVTEESVLQFDVNKGLNDMSNLQKSIESKAQMNGESEVGSDEQKSGEITVETTIETTVASEVVISEPKIAETEAEEKQITESVVESEVESVVDPKTDTSVGSDSVTKPQEMAESGAQSPPKYSRKTPTETVIKIRQIIDDKEWHKSREELNSSLIKKMFDLFNIKLNDNRINQMMDRAMADKLVIIEEKAKKWRYVLNYDRKLFGDPTNDWLCFECHSVREDEELIDCKKCFKAFHSNCLKGEHKVKDLKEETFECLYCRRSEQIDTDSSVGRLSGPELNKCVRFVVNNLQLSYETSVFDSLTIEDSEQNRVLVFKPMDVITIRQKALTDQYLKLEEAFADFKHFIHNFNVCRRDEASIMKDFERRVNHEMKELKLCVDCYKYSSDIAYDIEDDPHDWFTLVCDPPHELVFAKYGKYPYWPAKVIEMKAGGKQYDVRFFDAPDFSRAVVPLQRLRPINGFEFEDEDNELELPIKLLEKHIHRIKEKGLRFHQTVKMAKKSAKKRPNTDPKASDRPNKRPKKTTDN